MNPRATCAPSDPVINAANWHIASYPAFQHFLVKLNHMPLIADTVICIILTLTSLGIILLLHFILFRAISYLKPCHIYHFMHLNHIMPLHHNASNAYFVQHQ